MAGGSRKAAVDVRQRLLVLRCQAGDERAFAELFETFGSRSLRYLRGLVGNDDADDVHQEVWLSVYRRIAGLADPAGFRTWLLTTTRNRAIDHLRKRNRNAGFLETGDTEHREIRSEETASLDEWEQSWLQTSITRLPGAQREALVLRYWDDLSYGEIAVIVGCSVGTVRSRLHNAKAALRNMYAELKTTASTTPDEMKETP